MSPTAVRTPRQRLNDALLTAGLGVDSALYQAKAEGRNRTTVVSAAGGKDGA